MRPGQAARPIPSAPLPFSTGRCLHVTALRRRPEADDVAGVTLPAVHAQGVVDLANPGDPLDDVFRTPLVLALTHEARERYLAAVDGDLDIAGIDVLIIRKSIADILPDAFIGSLIALGTASGELSATFVPVAVLAPAAGWADVAAAHAVRTPERTAAGLAVCAVPERPRIAVAGGRVIARAALALVSLAPSIRPTRVLATIAAVVVSVRPAVVGAAGRSVRTATVGLPC